MQILFMISVVSLFVLLWASVAIIRRIRGSHRTEGPSSSQAAFSEYLFSAAEDASASQATFMQQAPSNPSSLQSHAPLDDEATSPKRG